MLNFSVDNFDSVVTQPQISRHFKFKFRPKSSPSAERTNLRENRSHFNIVFKCQFGEGETRDESILKIRNDKSFSFSFQLFVVVFVTCLAWELLVLPSDAQAALLGRQMATLVTIQVTTELD